MPAVATRTQTFTKVDIDRTFEFFESNLRMMATSADLYDEERMTDWAEDVVAFAHRGYLKAVHIMLFDAEGERIQAAKFTVNEEAGGWTSDLPGDNLWPQTPDGHMKIVLTYSATWKTLPEYLKERFKAQLRRPWGPTELDTSYEDMEPGGERHYASNGYGLEQTTFKRRNR